MNTEALIQPFLLVFVSEMGDKTQLLSLVLAARFRKPVPILLGILVATLLNHALASWAGSFLPQFFSPTVLKWILALTFFVFGVWILKPDQEEEFKKTDRWGPFLTTTVAFFFAEMGDKTQLATVALGAKFAEPILVTLGTTLGMMGADGLAVFFGHRFTGRLPMQWVRRVAAVIFILFGLGILIYGT